MRSGVIPREWFSIAGTWSATVLLELLEEVNRRKVKHDDLEEVMRVWISIRDRVWAAAAADKRRLRQRTVTKTHQS